MCCICGCIASLMDMLQRTITFMLACWLACVVCCGLTFAAAAGVAYGYNYSVAEFISLSSSDVTVYLRRGKFSDTPELQYKPRPGRRSGGYAREGNALEGDDHSANLTGDNEDGVRKEPQGDRKSLSETWVKAQDTRKYAEWLAKYGNGATGGTEYTDTATTTPKIPYYVVTVIPTRSQSHVSTIESDITSTRAVFIKRFAADTTPGQRAGRPDFSRESGRPIQDHETGGRSGIRNVVNE